jgi:hypothetical protein
MPQVDWSSVREWLSPAIAFLSLVVATRSHLRATREARLKEEESKARAQETRQYAETLESFAKAAQFAHHLKGMHEHAGTIAANLEALTSKSIKITEVATTQIEKSLEHLRKSTVAVEEISHQLRQIAKTSLAAHRDALRTPSTPQP